MNKMVLIIMLIVSSSYAATGLVPLPNEFKELNGSLELKSSATISYADKVAKQPAEMLAKWLRPATGFKLPVKKGSRGTIVFELLDDTSLGNEGYKLKVAKSVRISAQTPIGLSYAKIHPAGKLIDRRVWKSQSCSLKSLD
jgi:hypothetical protein